MTAQYWSRKMDGGYVWHGNKYKQIDGLRVQLPDDVAPRFEYPEEYLPYIKFTVGGEKLKYDDFESRFPIEEYKKIDGKAVWCEKTLTRQWRIIPNNESYKVSEGVSLERWLNAEPFQYDLPDRALHWGEDAIFSPTLMAKDTSRYKRRIYLCNRPILTIERTATTARMSPIAAEIPDTFNLWGPIDTDIPYVWPAEDGEPEVAAGAGPLTQYIWTQVFGTLPAINWEFSVADNVLRICFQGATLTFGDVDEIERCLGEDGDWADHTACEDVTNMFDHFIGADGAAVPPAVAAPVPERINVPLNRNNFLRAAGIMGAVREEVFLPVDDDDDEEDLVNDGDIFNDGGEW